MQKERSNFQSLWDIQRQAYHIPNGVDMISLNEKTGELRILQAEANKVLFERTQQEWRLVPTNYSFVCMMKAAKAEKVKTASRK